MTKPRRKNLLTGPSAYVLNRAQMMISIIFVAMCVLLIFMLYVVRLPVSVFTYIIFIATMGMGVALALVWTWRDLKEGAESRAGYTTFPIGHKDLEQRDPYMGYTLRLPGHEHLEAESFRSTIKRTAMQSRSRSSGDGAA
ncbi:hypothetical protein J2W21_003607 [Sinomonas atrocyanea]|uniref:hypothetical protein n=1 Tax=Sinomonas atrocyanea TaxID=37927 RepID=UPI002788927F|nr:hypothetical protein [Sinomonas atrocyanea]MDP9886082.1 hypothetical protein [Sinomonas atrocyanea]